MAVLVDLEGPGGVQRLVTIPTDVLVLHDDLLVVHLVVLLLGLCSNNLITSPPGGAFTPEYTVILVILTLNHKYHYNNLLTYPRLFPSQHWSDLMYLLPSVPKEIDPANFFCSD